MTTRAQTSPVYTFKPGPYSSHTALLAALPAPGNRKRVLDLGCAGGYLGEILAARGYDVVGVERPGGNTGTFPDTVRLVEADLEDGVPALDGKFDVIICADVLEHLRNPRKLLVELPGLLNGDGRLVASLPNSGNLYFRLVVLLGEFPQEERGLFDRTHLRFYNWKGWVHLLDEGGFRIESVQVTAIPLTLALPRWSDWLAVRLAERLFYGLARAWKAMFAYQFVVQARPRDRNG